MKALIECFGNTRSGMLGAAVNAHLNKMGVQSIEVETGGVERIVGGIFKRAGHSDIPLPEDVVATGYDVDNQFGQYLEAARRSIVTAERREAADVVMVADQNLATETKDLVVGLDLPTILKYAGHQAPVWGYDLDDASPRGALEVIDARDSGTLTEDTIQKMIEQGILKYHAPLGGDFKIGSEEAHKTEVAQLYSLGKLVAVELVADVRRT